MRQHLYSMLFVVFAAALWGCEAPPVADGRQAGPVEAAGTSEAVSPDDDPTVAAVREHAQMLAAAQRRKPTPAPAASSAANEVMWLMPGSDDSVPHPPAPRQGSPGRAPEPRVQLPEPQSGANTILDAAPAEAASPEASSPADAVQAMYERLEAAGESPFDRALRAAVLSLVEPGGELAARYLTPLSSDEQDAVRLYHELMLTMHRQLVAGGGRLDRDALAARMDDLFGARPISIRDLKLCRSVRGYGVYEPFESDTFLAGRENRAIVYVELEDFAAIDRGDGQFNVDLQQEVTLYSADGLAVWRNEPVTVNDVSANRRRDFFVVQLIKLPARLSVGKYRLKVRITDLNGGSIDERGLDLNLVADNALVNRSAQEAMPLR